MKRLYNLITVLLAVILVSACVEKLPETDGCGDLELTLKSAVGDFTMSAIRITDSKDLLLQNEEPVHVNADGTALSFHIPAGIYNDVCISIEAEDGRTGVFQPKQGSAVLINDGGLTRFALEVTSLKDNSAAGLSYLPEGRMFNMAVKAMVRQSPDSLHCTYSLADSTIKSISFVTESPSTDGIRIDNFEGAPAYAYYDKATGAITISTSAKAYRLNAYPAFMFDRLHLVESIDFGNMTAPAVYKTEHMFSYCRKLKTLDLSWIEDTSENTSMDNMFSYCESLESLDISHFRTTNVKHFRSLFNHCMSLKSIDLSNFDTSNALSVTYMFQYANSLERLDISSFTVSQLEAAKLNYMFYNMPNLKELVIGDNFVPKDNALPTNFFASTSLDFMNRAGSANRALTIYTTQKSADWLVKTNLRWINSGYSGKTKIPVTFIDINTGNKLTVKWAAN